ncbi:MAG: YbjQ family protein [Suipraeoptans sp.]
MVVVTTDFITGKELFTVGMVQGSTIQSKNIGKDIGSSFKTIIGGELQAYTKMMEEARGIATDRMVQQAAQMGADGVINVRYTSSAVMAGAAEILVYGTAVKFQ